MLPGAVPGSRRTGLPGSPSDQAPGTKQTESTNYSKCITFGDVLFLAPLAVESLHQIKYTAICAFLEVWISGSKSNNKSIPF